MTTMTRSGVESFDDGLLAALLSGERFWPSEPRTLEETGLCESFLEGLVAKYLFVNGQSSGRQVSTEICLPFPIIEPILGRLRERKHVVHVGSGLLNDYLYGLTEEGKRAAQSAYQECAYTGPAPVPLMDYVISVDAQAVADEPIRRTDLVDAFHDISIPPELLGLFGPAVNSAGGLFLYGAPGNGKSTLAQRITNCFGQEIWLPHAFIEGRNVVKLFDPAYHREAASSDDSTKPERHDRRWMRVRRPTVVVGGELTMENLEIRQDPKTNIGEAPLQMKSNCGCLLIDDFGRQRVTPEDLLNRWIIPLENRHDYLTLGSGKKIQVPFEQLIIFSTNLDPADLVDEAFLRRIQYRIEICDPSKNEFHELFQLAADRIGCSYNFEAVEYLLEKHYKPLGRPLRRCHARDLMQQIRNYCTYNDLPLEMLSEYFDAVAISFFTKVRSKETREAHSAARVSRTNDEG